jgi:CTP synthase (UTP-ammonia lyase)
MVQTTLKIGIIGDFKPTNVTHLATNAALAHAAAELALKTHVEWVPTPQIEQQGVTCLQKFDALWCSPGSPYASRAGALDAIRFAREANLPFFGT